MPFGSALRAGCAVAFIAATVTANAETVAGKYRLLKLEGHQVAWTMPEAGQTRLLTYSMVRSSQIYPSAFNCRGITSPAALLARSRISMTVWRREVAAAFAMWEAVSNLRFLEVDNVSADILIGAQADPDGWAFTNVDYDVRVPGNVKPITRALICLNPDRPWKAGFDGDLKSYDLRYTIAHEIGHAIGLDHPPDAGAIMHFRYDRIVPGTPER